MRRFLFPLAALALALPARADEAVPLVLVHEGRLLDASEALVQNPALAIKFEIFAEKLADSGQTPVWSGSCNVAVVNGYYATTLGGDCGTNLTSAAFPLSAARYLQVSIGGVALQPRQRLGLVPAAAVAANAEKVGGLRPADLWTRADAVNAATLGNKAPGEFWLKADAVNAATLGNKAPADFWLKADAVNAATLGSAQPSDFWKKSDAVDAATLGSKTLADLDARYVQSSGGGGGAVNIAGPVTVQTLSAQSATLSGSVTAQSFTGSGAGLTGLDAGKLTIGTIADARLPANLARTDGANTFTQAQTFAGVNANSISSTNETTANLTATNVTATNLNATNVVVSAGVRLGNDTSACTSANAGTLRYTGIALELCVSGQWSAIALGRIGSQTNPAKTCKLVLQGGGSTGDGVYWLDPDGAGSLPAYQAYCDMSTDGGGWTLVAYAGDFTGGFPRMDVDVGSYNPTSRVGKASKNAVVIARQSTELALAYASPLNFAGPISQTNDTVSFIIPNPTIVDFATTQNNGTCAAVTWKRHKPDGSTKFPVGQSGGGAYTAGVWTKSLGGTYSTFAYGLFATEYSCNSWPDVSHHWWVDGQGQNWEPSATTTWPNGVNGTAMIWLR